MSTNVYNWSSRPHSQSKETICTVADRVSKDNRLAPGGALNPQTGIYKETVGTTEQAQTMQFVDHNMAHTAEKASIMDSTRYSTSDDSTSFAKFFERPVQIDTFEWSPNGSINRYVLPWELYFTNKRVQNRIANYLILKAKLHVKFLINGNQFYWGKAFASYTPYTQQLIPTEANMAAWMPALQRQHIWLDPSTSLGGQLDLPFFYHADGISTTNPSYENMGLIWMQSLAELKHAQASTSTPVRITIYAWATEVELSAPTQVNPQGLTPQLGLVPQTGEVKDEYDCDGPISKPASTVAALAGAVASVPSPIEPFALATQKAAKMVGAAAAAFGFSRPREIAAEKPVRVWNTGNLTATDQIDSCDTLALTTKQEVTLDPRISGLDDVDELAFSHLNKIHSFFGRTTWHLSDATNQPLISIAVHPVVFNDSAVTIPPGPNAKCLTTTAFTALPFKYWRGEMSYRFQIAASAYHKGRLLAVWDPSAAAATPELNTVYSKIIDISEERDFVITVGWGNPFPGLIVRTPLEVGNTVPPPYTVRNLHTDVHHANGVLTLYVLNDLVTSGDNTDPITILCHSFSNDMHYWDPDGSRIADSTTSNPGLTEDSAEPQFQLFSRFLKPQMGLVPDEVGESTNETKVDEPNDAVDMHVGGKSYMDSIQAFLSGEEIVSFRTCMKRYDFARRIAWQGGVPVGNGLSVAATANSFFYTDPSMTIPTTIQGYVSQHYAAWRGSTRHRYIVRAADDGEMHFSNLAVSRTEGANWSTGNGNMISSYFPANQQGLLDLAKEQNGWSGMQVTTSSQGNTLTFEQPWYSHMRHHVTFPINTTSASLGHKISAYVVNNSQADQIVDFAVDHFVSIGEDYNLFYFLGVQPMWIKS